ncbi:ribonuclease BN [Sideroxyarcus emersonii]|uniref:Ribonuclease BN n=1 Tax=Sideroxyarcus emersonii TaxID=2764705 RepID=A0AAN1X8R0_9PROT|nr:3',5'-cyclic-nucleotide phosphodiesterase [Sideroxyarcus emersonii]BCK86657.1 ribonuclease BN [Sideroxyarcus emersonii]
MKLRILGCSGGIGGNLRTTSMLLDHDVLIDAGTGVGDLSLAEMCVIDHVFVTHSHLDHIASLPLLVDSVGFMRGQPLVIHATDETIAILKQHVFNWEIWPDFTEIPTLHQPLLRFERIACGETVEIGGRMITPLPANHVVPAVGFQIDSGKASLVFSGDTTTCDALWEAVNRIRNLEYLIVETAFSNAEKELAVVSKHLCPSLLADELHKLKLNPEIYVTHLKPGEIELTMQEVSECVRGFVPKMLQNGQVFEF